MVRLYAVSSGNGNDGVSHMFPDYYVYTNDPWRLATLAMVSTFKDEWKQAAVNACECDGESDYTISAVIYDPLDDDESSEESWSSVNGAWSIVDVFPDDDGPDLDDGWHKPIYFSLEHAFSDSDLALVRES